MANLPKEKMDNLKMAAFSEKQKKEQRLQNSKKNSSLSFELLGVPAPRPTQCMRDA
jgi:hypothetical protein